MRSSEVRKRVIKLAQYVVENNATVRQAGAQFGISKTNAWVDLTVRLPEIDSDLAELAAIVLAQNKATRHEKGGAKTRERFMKIKREARI